jgi:hypothetical protein
MNKSQKLSKKYPGYYKTNKNSKQLSYLLSKYKKKQPKEVISLEVFDRLDRNINKLMMLI